MQKATLLSIHIAQPKEVQWQNRTYRTSIYKERVEGPVRVTRTCIEGDSVGDRKVHGGPDKAVYAYGADAYEWWESKKGKLLHGAFGENLLISRLPEKEICLGDTFSVGDVILQVAEPRFPCSTLAMRFDDLQMVKLFNESMRHGIYFRVLKEGTINTGDIFELKTRHPAKVPFLDMVNFKLDPSTHREAGKRILELDCISEDWKRRIREKLEALK